MMRVGLSIIYAISLSLLWAPYPMAQDKAGTAKIARHKDIAKLMSSLHNWGVDREVTRQIDGFRSKIAQDLEYAGQGGVLVVARFEKVETDSGTYRRLISNRVDYVGIGATDVDAEIAGMANAGKSIPYHISQGWQLDVKDSNAYWFKMDSGGEIVLREKPLDLLRNEVVNEAARRKSQSFDENAARSAELTRLSKIMTEKVGRDKVATTTSELDLPLNFHPAAIRASADLNTPSGAVLATGGNAKLSSRAALEPVAAMDPA